MGVDNDDKREMREMIAHKNISDEALHRMICDCAKKGWVEELRLCVNVPRSSVECFYTLLVQLRIFSCFFVLHKIHKIVV